MNSVFKPAVIFMNKLKYPVKLILIGVVTTLAVAILACQLVVQSLSTLNFSTKELVGVKYVGSLSALSNSIQHYTELYNLAMVGDKTAKEKLPAQGNEVDRIITEMNQANDDNAKVLNTTTDWTNIVNTWKLWIF